MIAIVVVSHSRPLAEAAVTLARQMSGADLRIEIAAGADGGLGTDAAEIAAAIDRAASADGILVVMDLGSAILSAEMALELRSSVVRVVLSPAPFVEGLVSAAVLASAGADLDAVAREVRGAFDAKRAQLGESATGASEPVATRTNEAGREEASVETVVRNPSGLHARPAAEFVRTARRFDAAVRVADLTGSAEPAAGDSLLSLMSLGIDEGAHVRISATGRDAEAAVTALSELIDSGFGEV